MKRALFIINPTAGTQTIQKVAHQFEQRLLLEQVVSYATITYTAGKGDAAKKCAALKPGEYDFLVAVGGDGTINEVVNGLMMSRCNIPLVILPAGTCNDFASSAGLPKTVEGLMEMIHHFQVVTIDVGRIDQDYFLNVAAGGMLSEVAHRVSSDSKTVLGRLAYLLEGTKEITKLRFDTVPLHIQYDDKEMNIDAFFFLIANSTSIGGFRNMLPRALINDGLLDLCVVQKITPLDILPLAAQIQQGSHINNKCVCYLQAKKFVIDTLQPDAAFPLDCDGEAGGTLPIEVETIPDALPLIVPAQCKKLTSTQKPTQS